MDMINVLWIDDECRNESGSLTIMGKQFVEYAYELGIEIFAYSTYKDGLKAIKETPHKWIAVILDIREQRATDGGMADGYMSMRDKIRDLHKDLGQEEPYIFTLSGEKRFHEKDSAIPHETYCRKRVYDKNLGDYKLLFEDIHKIENISTLYRLTKEYGEVLNRSSVLGGASVERLINLMWLILIKQKKDEVLLLNEIRKYVEEFIIDKLEGDKFFPDECKTLNQRSLYIGKQNEIPEYIKRSFHNIVSVTQEGSHAKTIVDKDVREGKAPYLLQSSLFCLLNIVYWLGEDSNI